MFFSETLFPANFFSGGLFLSNFFPVIFNPGLFFLYVPVEIDLITFKGLNSFIIIRTSNGQKRSRCSGIFGNTLLILYEVEINFTPFGS